MVLVILYIVAGLALSLAGALIFDSIVEDVNKTLPERRRFWSVLVTGRAGEYLARHKGFYPRSRKRIAIRVVNVIWIVFFIVPLVLLWIWGVRHS